MNCPYRKHIWLVVFFLFCLTPARASDDFLSRAETSLNRKDRASAEFWLTRHLAQNSFVSDEPTKLLLKSLKLEPKGFVPASWPLAVRRWFFEHGRVQWGVEPAHIHADERRFEVASAVEGDYFATLTAVPEIQAWYDTQDGLSTTREILVAGASKPAPFLAFGRRIQGALKSQPTAILRISSLRALHHGSLSFQDVDGDKTPELLLRLTWVISNGFRQTLKIYRIVSGGQLELWKTADAPTGFFLRVGLGGQTEPIDLKAVKENNLIEFLD